jgi:hypothetical protein
MMGADLRRWGLSALAILAVGFLGGRCSAYTGPLGRQAELVVDSVRIARAAAKQAEATAQRSFGVERDVMLSDLATARAAQPIRIVRTVRATAGLDTGLARLRAAVQDVPRLRALVDTALAQADALRGAQALERAGAAQAAASAQTVIRTDSVELGRRARQIGELQHQIDLGLDREAALAKKLRGGWTLGVTIGPGASFNGQTVRGAPVQVSVGASHEVHIGLPHFF